MRISEAGALDLLKDIEKGENHGVELADLAPDPNNNTAGYDANEDPEMDGSASTEEPTAPVKEATVNRYLQMKKLIEAKNDAITSFLQSGTDDKSFDAFKNSSFYEDSKNRKGEYCSQREYIDGVKWLLKNGRVDQDDVGNALAGTASSARNNAYADIDDDDGPYKRGDDFDAENYVQSDTLAAWSEKYADAPGVQDVNEVFDDMEDIVREIVVGVADKRHAMIAGDPGIGKTYTVRKVIEQYIEQSGKKLFYSAGAMSPSMTSVVPFFFFHKDNEIIILDDNDKVIMKACDQNTQNFMKAVLDPSALKKPVSVPTTMMSKFQAQLDMISGLNESTVKAPKEGTRVDIDMEALKEGFFKYSINGVVADQFKLDEKTKLELTNMIRPASRLKEAFDDEDDDVFADTDDDANEYADGDGQSEYTMEPSFIFNSSVVFISNLKLTDISPAVADRCECCEISLTLPQFVQRLETVMGGLCKGEDYSSRPQWMRDWGKQSAYTAFLGIIEAFNAGATLFGRKVTIRRKFTFRLFEEMANEWCRGASSYAMRHELNIEDKEVQRQVAEKITGKFVLSLMNKINQRG